jgi:RHS repeat-associated protein
LVYDPLGRLFQTSGGVAGVTQFLYDGEEMVAEYGATGNVLKRYVLGDGGEDPLYWYEGSGLAQPRYPHIDRKGSIIAIAGPSGTIQTINNYDEYGIPGAGNTGRFQYTGQAWIPELGMYHYKAPIYSPTLGRFLQISGDTNLLGLTSGMLDDVDRKVCPGAQNDWLGRDPQRGPL